MHVPPYYRKRSWQVFIVGVVVGTIIAYLIFVLMYGKLYGDLLIERTELETELKDLQRQNETLLLDKEQLQREQRLTVQTIDIHFVNGKQFRFDRLTIHQLSSLIKDELEDIIGKDVTTVAESSTLMINLIEKNTFEIDDISYTFTIEKMVIAENMEINLQVKFAT